MSQMIAVHPLALAQLQERAARCTALEKAAAEVVAELRETQSVMRRNGRRIHESIYEEAADLVAKKLGVES